MPLQHDRVHPRPLRGDRKPRRCTAHRSAAPSADSSPPPRTWPRSRAASPPAGSSQRRPPPARPAARPQPASPAPVSTSPAPPHRETAQNLLVEPHQLAPARSHINPHIPPVISKQTVSSTLLRSARKPHRRQPLASTSGCSSKRTKRRHRRPLPPRYPEPRSHTAPHASGKNPSPYIRATGSIASPQSALPCATATATALCDLASTA